jgi:hypothetical protein
MVCVLVLSKYQLLQPCIWGASPPTPMGASPLNPSGGCAPCTPAHAAGLRPLPASVVKDLSAPTNGCCLLSKAKGQQPVLELSLPNPGPHIDSKERIYDPCALQEKVPGSRLELQRGLFTRWPFFPQKWQGTFH